jgi:hypothetical protein
VQSEAHEDRAEAETRAINCFSAWSALSANGQNATP